MKIHTISTVVVVAILVAGCGKQNTSSGTAASPTNEQTSAASAASPVATSTAQFHLPVSSTKPPVISEWDKVKISGSGEIFVNKKQVSLSEFATECQRLKQAGGAAMVYTGDGDHVIAPAQLEAVRKLMDAGVPMKAVQKESELD